MAVTFTHPTQPSTVPSGHADDPRALVVVMMAWGEATKLQV